MRLPLAETIGLKGEWVCLHEVWDGEKYNTQISFDGNFYRSTTEEEIGEYNLVSILYVGGPKDGKLES